MLADRILATIQFFDLQSMPLTAFEVERYLISDVTTLRPQLDKRYELVSPTQSSGSQVHSDTILLELDHLVENKQLEKVSGFYVLPGKLNLVDQRLRNYRFAIPRERRIRHWLGFTRHIPFIRGIALAGSQAFGLPRATSDIDVLIITDHSFMWLARTLLTIYFQLLGIRRHGKKISNRVCLNHYIGRPREVDAEKNLYKAMEYTKLRAVVYPETVRKFQIANRAWIKTFFPQVQFPEAAEDHRSVIQFLLETVLNNRVGVWFEKQLQYLQMRRIRQSEFIFVRDDELSFHPESKHEALLKGFFETEKTV